MKHDEFTLNDGDLESTRTEVTRYIKPRTRYVRDDEGVLYEVTRVVTSSFDLGDSFDLGSGDSAVTHSVEGLKVRKDGQRPDRSNYPVSVGYTFEDVSAEFVQ